MHFSEFKPPLTPTHLAARLAMCALLPVFIQDASAALPGSPSRPSLGRSLPTSRSSGHAPSSPYLLVCLPPALRFADPVETAEPVSPAPNVLGPPHPAGLVEEIASVNQAAALPRAPAAVHSPVPSPAGPKPESHPPSTPEIETPPETGVAIIPDDTPREIGSADVLLYFQFPANSPSGAQPPRSSATYQQQ